MRLLEEQHLADRRIAGYGKRSRPSPTTPAFLQSYSSSIMTPHTPSRRTELAFGNISNAIIIVAFVLWVFMGRSQLFRTGIASFLSYSERL